MISSRIKSKLQVPACEIYKTKIKCHWHYGDMIEANPGNFVFKDFTAFVAGLIVKISTTRSLHTGAGLFNPDAILVYWIWKGSIDRLSKGSLRKYLIILVSWRAMGRSDISVTIVRRQCLLSDWRDWYASCECATEHTGHLDLLMLPKYWE